MRSKGLASHLTIAQAGALLGITPETCRNWCVRGFLRPAYRYKDMGAKRQRPVWRIPTGTVLRVMQDSYLPRQEQDADIAARRLR